MGFLISWRRAARVLLISCVGALTSCANNGSTHASPAAANLVMSVGSLNDSAGALTGQIGVYLNVVASFRTPGAGGAFVNPSVAVITAPYDPLSPSPNPGQPNPAPTFYGCSIFAYGQNPSAVLSGTPTKGYPQSIVYGLPPAFPAPPSGQVGDGIGFLYFFKSDCITLVRPPAPIPGLYSILATVGTGGTPNQYSGTATLPASFTTLPNELAPSFTATGGGGGTFNFAQPAGVTESLIVITQGTIANGIREVATLKSTSTSATLPAGTIPPGMYVALVIGADYPIVEAGPPTFAGSLTGPSGTADLTISTGSTFTI